LCELLGKTTWYKDKLFTRKIQLTDLFRKNLLHIPGHNGWSKDELIYKDVGYIFHFNAIPKNDRHVEYWMKRTYEEWFK